MIKSLREVDEAEVKRVNETAQDWQAYCPICKKQITGTIAQLREHGECHDK